MPLLLRLLLVLTLNVVVVAVNAAVSAAGSGLAVVQYLDLFWQPRCNPHWGALAARSMLKSGGSDLPIQIV